MSENIKLVPIKLKFRHINAVEGARRRRRRRRTGAEPNTLHA